MDLSLLSTLAKIVAVFGLLFLTLSLVGRLYSRRPRSRGSADSPWVAPSVEIIERVALGRQSTLILVRIGAQGWALGVTEQQVTLLGEVEIDLAIPSAGTQTRDPRPAWSDFIEAVRERTVRA